MSNNKSVYTQITTLVAVTSPTSTNTSSNIYSQNVLPPASLGVNTIYYVDGSDPQNLSINGLLTSTNGFVDLSGYSLFFTTTFSFSGTTYPTS